MALGLGQWSRGQVETVGDPDSRFDFAGKELEQHERANFLLDAFDMTRVESFEAMPELELAEGRGRRRCRIRLAD